MYSRTSLLNLHSQLSLYYRVQENTSIMLGSCIAGLSLWSHGKKKACSFLKEWFLLPLSGPQSHTVCRAGATSFSPMNYQESNFSFWWGSFTHDSISWGWWGGSGSGWAVKPNSSKGPELTLWSRISKDVSLIVGRETQDVLQVSSSPVEQSVWRCTTEQCYVYN